MRIIKKIINWLDLDIPTVHWTEIERKRAAIYYWNKVFDDNQPYPEEKVKEMSTKKEEQ